MLMNLLIINLTTLFASRGDCVLGPAGLIEKRRQTVKRVSLDSPALYYMARDCETFGYYFYDSNIYSSRE